MIEHAATSSTSEQSTEHPEPRARKTLRFAGVAFSSAAVLIVLGVVTGEALYPRRYTTFDNTISDLSGTEPPHSVMLQPSRSIFIATMLVAGMLVLAGTWALARAGERRRFVVAMTCLGGGLVGVGVFPGNVEGWHPLAALVCFLGGAVAAIVSRRSIDGPFRYFAVALGTVALVSVGFGLESLEHWGPQAELGRGGIERWIAYPVLLWLVGFGAHLMHPCVAESSSEHEVRSTR